MPRRRPFQRQVHIDAHQRFAEHLYGYASGSMNRERKNRIPLEQRVEAEPAINPAAANLVAKFQLCAELHAVGCDREISLGPQAWKTRRRNVELKPMQFGGNSLGRLVLRMEASRGQHKLGVIASLQQEEDVAVERHSDNA